MNITYMIQVIFTNRTQNKSSLFANIYNVSVKDHVRGLLYHVHIYTCTIENINEGRSNGVPV